MTKLTRKPGQSIQIGADITIYIANVQSNGEVRIGIDAPQGVAIRRDDGARAGAELGRAVPGVDDPDKPAADDSHQPG